MLRGCTLHASRRCAPAETPPRRDRGPPFAARLARRYARLYAYAASQGNAAKPGKIRYGVTRLTPSAPLRAQRRTAYIQIHSSPIRRFLSCRRWPSMRLEPTDQNGKTPEEMYAAPCDRPQSVPHASAPRSALARDDNSTIPERYKNSRRDRRPYLCAQSALRIGLMTALAWLYATTHPYTSYMLI